MKIVSIILVAGLFFGGCSSKDENGFPECDSKKESEQILNKVKKIYSPKRADVQEKLIDFVDVKSTKTDKECRATYQQIKNQKIIYEEDIFYDFIKTKDGKILVEL